MARKKTTRARKQSHWLNQREMAKSIGISVNAFAKWGITPVAKIGREAFYTVDDVLEFYTARELAKVVETYNEPSGKIQTLLDDPDLAVFDRIELLKGRKLELENASLELRNQILEGKSLPSWAVTEVLARILSRAGEILDGLPPKIRRRHPKIDKRVVELIRTETIKLMNETANLSEYLDEIVDSVVAEAEERIR